MLKRKKYVALGMVFVICLAVFLNWQYKTVNDNLADPTSVIDGEFTYDADKILGEAKLVSTGGDEVSVSAYFDSAKMTRQTTRDETIEQLNGIVGNKNNTEEVKQKAGEDLTKIATSVEVEGKIENQIVAKGFAAALAIVSDDSATVMVQTTGLQQNEVAQINEIVQTETGLAAKDIKVVEIN